MPTATRKKRTTRLTDAQLEEMLALTAHADSVELKLTVPDSERRATLDALGMDPLEAQIRQVFFFDTPDLALNKVGVVVRARRVQVRGDDTVVKLRPIVPDQLHPSVRKAKTMVVEVDAMPGGYVCSASFKGSLGPGGAVKQVATGDRAIRKLYSKEQRAFYATHAPEGLGLDDLSVLGPINVFKLEVHPQGVQPAHGGRAVAVPGRGADPGAVDQVRPERGLPGRRRGPGVPGRAGRRPVRRAADQDQDRPGLLRQERPGGCRIQVIGPVWRAVA